MAAAFAVLRKVDRPGHNSAAGGQASAGLAFFGQQGPGHEDAVSVRFPSEKRGAGCSTRSRRLEVLLVT